MKAVDAKFARELAARLVSDLDLDPRSVFATGMSNGGNTCYLLACQPQPFVQAIAPTAGCMMLVWTNSFMLPARLSVMEVHGTSDGITHWNGDLPNHDGYGAYLGTEAVMDFWVRKLALEKSSTMEIGGNSSAEKRVLPVRLHHWWTTMDSVAVRLYEIQGGHHDWPGHLGNPEISTAEDIWNFFQRHRPGFFRILFCPPCAS